MIGENIIHLTTIRGGVMDVIFSPNGKLLASVTLSGKVTLWDLYRDVAIMSFSLHNGDHLAAWNASLAFDQTGSRLLAFTDDGALLKIWDISMGELIVSNSIEGMNIATISPDGSNYATGGDGWIMYDTSNQIVRSSLTKEPIGYLAFSPNAQILYTTNWFTGEFSAWNTNTGEELFSLNNCDSTCKAEGPMNAYAKFGLTSDGSRLALVHAYPNYMVGVWDTQVGTLLALLGADSYAVAISSDGTRIAALSQSTRSKQYSYSVINFWNISPELSAEIK